MLWGQLLQCTTAEEGNMASRLLLKACLPNSHTVHTERHTYHTYACNRESVIWKTEVHLVLGTKLKTFCRVCFWKLPAVKLGSSYICICMASHIFPLFLILQFPPCPVVSVLVMKGYLKNCNMSNLTWYPHDQKSGYTWQWCTSGLIWQLWWQWHRELQFWTISLFHVTVVLRYWHLQ